MTRNQKIALGCGGAGCLGMIVVVIAACLIFYFASSRMSRYERAARDYNFNVNLNSNSNSNDDANGNSNSSSSSSASSMSDDGKHKLYYAAVVTGDTALIQRVSIHIGIMNDDGVPNDEYGQFMIEHAAWAVQNLEFAREFSTREKAQAYVDENFE